MKYKLANPTIRLRLLQEQIYGIKNRIYRVSYAASRLKNNNRAIFRDREAFNHHEYPCSFVEIFLPQVNSYITRNYCNFTVVCI